MSDVRTSSAAHSLSKFSVHCYTDPELARAQRSAQLDQYRSTAGFLSRLYDLTRGRRNKGQLAEARTALEAAQAEAAELAKTDPAAAAQLLAARQEMIINGIERKRQEAQLRRDARRGGGLASGDVEEEIRLVNEAQAAADQAAIDAILTGAKERADDRKRSKEETAAANQEALDDLDQTYKDQKTAQETARKEQVDRQNEDRRLDKQRRDADFAAQLQELVDSNADRLGEFESAHKARITQIGVQATESARAIDAALALEDKEFGEARAKINSDYDTFLTGLRTKIEDAIKAINLTPGEQQRIAETEAWGLLADAFGAVFTQRGQEAIDWGKILTPPAGDLHDRHPGTDPRLSQGAINSIVTGGRQTDTFSSGRVINGRPSVHGGVDIAPRIPGTTGEPVLSPTDGRVAKVGYTDVRGHFVDIVGADGSRWSLGHLEAATVREGQQIRRGQQVGRLGASGQATGPHVHVSYTPPGGSVTDPTATLNNGAVTQQRMSAGSAYQAQARSTMQPLGQQSDFYRLPMERPRIDLPSMGGAVNLSHSVIIDLSQASFGPGVNRSEIEGWLLPVVEDAFTRHEQAEMVEINRLRNSGSWRAS